jgi:hypothetical protein
MPRQSVRDAKAQHATWLVPQMMKLFEEGQAGRAADLLVRLHKMYPDASFYYREKVGLFVYTNPRIHKRCTTFAGLPKALKFAASYAEEDSKEGILVRKNRFGLTGRIAESTQLLMINHQGLPPGAGAQEPVQLAGPTWHEHLLKNDD